MSLASDNPKTIQEGVDPRGKQIFEGACASCHGWNGVGVLTSHATLTGSRTVNDASAINLAHIVTLGEHRTTDGALMMPDFGAAYSNTEIAAVANYVTARFGAAPSALTAEHRGVSTIVSRVETAPKDYVRSRTDTKASWTAMRRLTHCWLVLLLASTNRMLMTRKTGRISSSLCVVDRKMPAILPGLPLRAT